MSDPLVHSKLHRAMEEGVTQGVFPGGVLEVIQGGEQVHRSAHGRLSVDPPGAPVSAAACYDMASLTKVLATTPVVLDLVDRGQLNLDGPLDLPQPVTLRHLLEHSSGLPAWRPFFEEVAAAQGGSLIASQRGLSALRALLFAEPLEAPPGQRALYSDLGFMWLDWIIERQTGQPLDRVFRDRICRPLGCDDLFFLDLKRPAAARRARKGRLFAATEKCPWRGRTLIGEVHDDNAYAMGGVAGHAGLFGSAAGVARLCQEWLEAYHHRRSRFNPELVRQFWRRSTVPGSTRVVGFDTPSPEGSQAGSRMGPGTVGHTGFTGTSLWIDPARELTVILLTNRVHPQRTNEAIRTFRPRIHDLVNDLCGHKGVKG